MYSPVLSFFGSGWLRFRVNCATAAFWYSNEINKRHGVFCKLWQSRYYQAGNVWYKQLEGERLNERRTVLTAGSLITTRTLAQLCIVSDAAAAVVTRTDVTRSWKRQTPIQHSASSQWRIQKLWKREWRRSMYQPRRHLSQTHTTNYMPLYGKRRIFEEKILSQDGRPLPPTSFPSESTTASSSFWTFYRRRSKKKSTYQSPIYRILEWDWSSNRAKQAL